MWPSFSGQPFYGQFFITLTLLRLLSCHFQPKVLSFVWEGETTQSSFASFTLAHAVASTVELFNSTGSLTHIMIFFSSSIIIFHFASLEYPLLECTPHSSLSAPGSTRLVGTPPPLVTCPPQPHPSLPGLVCLLALLLVGRGVVYLEVQSWRQELSFGAGLWPLRIPRPVSWGCASSENRIESVAFATLTQVRRVSLSARVSSSSPGSLSRALTCIVC